MSKFTSDYEREKYTKMHDGRSSGYKGGNHGIGLIEPFCQLIVPEAGHVVELGSGNGKAAEYLLAKGLTVTCMDIAPNARCHQIKKRGLQSVVHSAWEPWPREAQAEWFFTADFFEHLPPEQIDEVFNRIKENVKLGGVAKICTVPDVSGPHFVQEPLHLTVEGPGWWTSKFTNHFRHVRVLQSDDSHITIFTRRELEEVIGNLRESGMDEKLLNEIARSVETSGKYEGIHDLGHFTIRRLP